MKFWYNPKQTFWSIVLYPLSLVYKYFAQSKYKKDQLTSCKGDNIVLSTPVIVVGNITVGGSGKTPMVRFLFRYLHALGMKVAVISRGYTGNYKGLVHLSDSSNTELVGDEMSMQYAYCKRQGLDNIDFIVCRDRLQAALYAQSLGVDFIIADDGLQHYKLPRHLEIVVIGPRGLGNQLFIPAGPIRESPDRLSKADYIIDNRPHNDSQLTRDPIKDNNGINDNNINNRIDSGVKVNQSNSNQISGIQQKQKNLWFIKVQDIAKANQFTLDSQVIQELEQKFCTDKADFGLQDLKQWQQVKQQIDQAVVKQLIVNSWANLSDDKTTSTQVQQEFNTSSWNGSWDAKEYVDVVNFNQPKLNAFLEQYYLKTYQSLFDITQEQLKSVIDQTKKQQVDHAQQRKAVIDFLSLRAFNTIPYAYLAYKTKAKASSNYILPQVLSSTNKKVIALCAIAYPQGFQSSLESLGFEVVEMFSFADHHKFTQQDIDKIYTNNPEYKELSLLVTEKDAIKLAHLKLPNKAYFLEREGYFEQTHWLDQLKSKLIDLYTRLKY